MTGIHTATFTYRLHRTQPPTRHRPGGAERDPPTPVHCPLSTGRPPTGRPSTNIWGRPCPLATGPLAGRPGTNLGVTLSAGRPPAKKPAPLDSARDDQISQDTKREGKGRKGKIEESPAKKNRSGDPVHHPPLSRLTSQDLGPSGRDREIAPTTLGHVSLAAGPDDSVGSPTETGVCHLTERCA